MHEKEETPNQEEHADNKSNDGWQCEIEMLKGKSIQLFGGSVLRAEGKDQKHPEVKKQCKQKSLNKRQNEKFAIFLEKVVNIIDIIYGEMYFLLKCVKYSNDENREEETKYSYDY